MSEQANNSSPYPGGHIQYSFRMHVGYDGVLSFQIGHPRVREVIIEKEKPDDQYDSEWHITIHFGPVCTIDEVQNIGNTIKDDVLDTLSLILNSKISEVKTVSYNVMPRNGEGAIGHSLLPLLQSKGYGRVGVRQLSNDDITEVKSALLTMFSAKNDGHIILFRHAISNDDPVVQFLILYLILFDNKKQEKVDEIIMKFAPSTTQSLSPFTQKSETIYTRLRNEIAHRANVNLDSTRAEIIDNLNDFRAIVQQVIKSEI